MRAAQAIYNTAGLEVDKAGMPVMRVYPSDPRTLALMTQFMLAQVSRQAIADGVPLTEDDKNLLASRSSTVAVSAQFKQRVTNLISIAMDREPPVNAGRLDRKMRLADTLKYIGDRKDWPYIAHLVSAVRKGRPSRHAHWTVIEWCKDKGILFAYVLLVMLALFAFSAVVALFEHLR
jgi:hypothetical protein